MKVIKWTNKYSNEVGYVKAVKKAQGHFVNADSALSAKGYKTAKAAEKVISDLIAMGEGENNNFEVVEADA